MKKLSIVISAITLLAVVGTSLPRAVEAFSLSSIFSCGADLIASSFVLTDAKGKVKTEFASGEAIYPKLTIKNQGSVRAESETNNTLSVFHRSVDGRIEEDLWSDSNVILTAGEFSAGMEYTYEAAPGGERAGGYRNNHSWTVVAAGDYKARVVINADGAACENRTSNNQYEVRYRITAPAGAESNLHTQIASPDGSDLRSTSSKGWRNSLVYSYRGITLQQVGYYGTGMDDAYEIRLSDKYGTIGALVAKGTLNQVSNGYYYDNLTQVMDADSYYIIRVNQRDGTTKLLTRDARYQDVWFMGYSGGNDPANKAGSYQLRLKYDASKVRLKFNLSDYTKLGFPAPQYPNPRALTDGPLERFRNYGMNAIVKASDKSGVDVGIIGAWAERESAFDNYMDNCNDGDKNGNTPCYYWGYSWQAGYGVHVGVSTPKLAEAMQKMHPGASAEEVGQQVIDESYYRYSPWIGRDVRLSYPSTTFGKTSLKDIVSRSQSGDIAMRAKSATLIKDEAIGAYLIGLNFRDIVTVGPTLAYRMQAWGGHYSRQTIINVIKALYDAGIYL